jgi:hypothetical protein
MCPGDGRSITPWVDRSHNADAVVQRALAKDQASRFATIDAFASALVAVVDDTPPPLIILARVADPPPASTVEPARLRRNAPSSSSESRIDCTTASSAIHSRPHVPAER